LPITVTDTLPFPLTLNGLPTGDGWDCSGSTPGGVTVHCVTNAILLAGELAPPITVNVDIGQTILRRIENMARVSTPNDTNPDNDTSTDIIRLQPRTRTAPSVSPLGIVIAVLVLLSLGFTRLRRASIRR
jgi:hypothetical protein